MEKENPENVHIILEVQDSFIGTTTEFTGEQNG